MLRYGSVCSGVEAATAAWHSLGWKPQWFSEIEAFPSAVLAHHYPDTPNRGDMTKFKEWPDDSINLLVGGTPCQSFSVAGLRKGLDDPRGNLMLTYLAIAARYSPKWLVWENVPGVLSSNGGRDFGTFLGALGQLGYGFAYRVLDAQYFGVAQRRRRVFVVGCLGDWRRAAAVLFERESLSGHPAPSRETREEAAGYTATSFGKYSEGVGTVRAAGVDLGGGSETLIPMHGGGFDDARAICFSSKDYGADALDDLSPTLPAGGHNESHANAGVPPAICVPLNTQLGLRGPDTSNTSREGIGIGNDGDPSFTLQAAHSHGIISPFAVRRLTPRECERLQGFPDDYTLIPYRNKLAADGHRYKAMGNSMAVPVMRWIGKRIQMAENYAD